MSTQRSEKTGCLPTVIHGQADTLISMISISRPAREQPHALDSSLAILNLRRQILLEGATNSGPTREIDYSLLV